MPPETSYKKIDTGIFEFYRRGWSFVKGDYWLFFGVTVVGMILAGFTPMGVLMGPLICGIYLCFIKKDLGKPIRFGLLFRGFDYFLQSFVATLIMILGSIIITIPYMVLAIGGIVGIVFANENGNAVLMVLSIAFLVLITIISMIAMVIITIPYNFALIQILENNEEAWPAFKAGLAATWLNFWKLALLIISLMLLSGIAVLFCYIPVFFLGPLFFGVLYAVYRDLVTSPPKLPPPPLPA